MIDAEKLYQDFVREEGDNAYYATVKSIQIATRFGDMDFATVASAVAIRLMHEGYHKKGCPNAHLENN